MTERPPRRAIAVALAAALPACVPATELGVDLRGAAAVLVAQVRGPEASQVISVRALDPFDPDAQLTFADMDGVTTAVLAYARPLAEYRLSVDDRGELVRDPQGVPLPPPERWLPVGGSVTEDWRGHPLEGVRVPPRRCFELIEIHEERANLVRLGFDPNSEVTFAAPLDAHRTLIALAAPHETWTSSVAVVTATSARRVRLPLPPSPAGATGTVDADGTVWLLALAGTPLVPYECRLDAAAAGPARCARASTPPGSPLLPLRTAGRRRTDGRWEMAAMSWDLRLFYRLGGAADDDGAWIELYQGGVFDAPTCASSRAFVSLTLDGPGTGVASFESGALERFTVQPEGVERTRLFELGNPTTACRSAYARARGGAEVFVRIPEIHVGFEETVTPRAAAWWRRSEHDTWLPLSADLRLDPRAVRAVGDALMVSSASHTLTTALFDPLRPDLPPQMCGSTYALSDASHVVAIADDELMVAGQPASVDLSAWYATRWRLVGR